MGFFRFNTFVKTAAIAFKALREYLLLKKFWNGLQWNNAFLKMIIKYEETTLTCTARKLFLNEKLLKKSLQLCLKSPSDPDIFEQVLKTFHMSWSFSVSQYNLKKCSLSKIQNYSFCVNFTHFRAKTHLLAFG